MRVQMRLFGELATLTGQPELTLELADGADLRGLLAAADAATGRAVSSGLLFDEEIILPSVALLVNGTNVLLGEGLRTSLSDGDQVSVMPLLGGG